MEMVDKHEMVQQVVKSKNPLPSFVLFTEKQIVDLKYTVAHQKGGVDRTFNLGPFYATALVYKNQRIVKKENPSEHPLFLGPTFLHKEATFEAYHLFFSSIKAKLCKENSVHAVEIRIDKDVLCDRMSNKR